MVEFLLRGFRRPGAMVETALGRLEREILNRLWADAEPLSVRALEASFGGTLAYTTLMTTLDRLHRKGLVERAARGTRVPLPRARSRASSSTRASPPT